MSDVKNVLLVHGGFVDGSGWQAVYDLLRADGFNVRIVQNPTITLEGDVAATTQIIDAQEGPVVLVGHSYGGVVITEAGMHDQVEALVYIAAFAPDKGESVSSLIADPPPGAPVPPILPPQDGFLFLDRDQFAASFAGDVPAGEAAFMADSQVPWGVDALGGTVTDPAWRSKPGGVRRPHDPAARAAFDGRAGRRHRRRGPGQPFGLRVAASGRGRPDHQGGTRLIAAETPGQLVGAPRTRPGGSIAAGPGAPGRTVDRCSRPDERARVASPPLSGVD